MRECKHRFIGKFDGVHCQKCGLHLTARQYHELLHPPKGTERPAPKRKTSGKEGAAI